MSRLVALVDLFVDVIVDRVAHACFLILVGLYAGAAVAATVASDPAASFEANTADNVLQMLALHAGTIAVIIRALVRLARSATFGNVWDRVPVRYRPAVLVGLGLAAVAFERVALGESWEQAIFVAVGGVGGAVTSHEMQERAAAKSTSTDPVDPV